MQKQTHRSTSWSGRPDCCAKDLAWHDFRSAKVQEQTHLRAAGRAGEEKA
jgi:hypothetical protein